MLERINPVLRIVGLGLAALLLYQGARLLSRKSPLDNLAIPTTLSPTPAPATPAGPTGTNALSPPKPASTQALPPVVQARVERIVQSEILGPVMRPLPMALLGIAGRNAFLRAPNGQTGLLKEGEELGGIKLLRIGTNRVLVEHEQQPKELTLFSGFGGEPLLPKGKETPP